MRRPNDTLSDFHQASGTHPKTDSLSKPHDQVSFGESAIDELLGGGMNSGSFYLLEYEPGTGEIAFLGTYLNEGLSQGDFCCVISCERPSEYLIAAFANMGVNVRKALDSGSLLMIDLCTPGTYDPDSSGPILRTEKPSDPASVLRLYGDTGRIFRSVLGSGKFKTIRSIEHSLSAQLMVYKFETTYRVAKAGIDFAREDLRLYPSHVHSSLSSMNRKMVNETMTASLEHLYDGVIMLSTRETDGKYQKLLRIKESPLAGFCSDEVPYEIVDNKPFITVSISYPPRPSGMHLGALTIDDISHKLISELQKDGRKTFQEIGKSLGYTGAGIRKRVNNLVDHGVMKVSALLNTSKLKLFTAVTMLEIESAQALDRILDRFRKCPRVVNMFTTLGGVNTIALTIAEDLDTLQSVSLQKCSLRSNAGIRRSDFYPIGTVHYSSYLPVQESLARRDLDIAPCKSNCGTCERYRARKCVGCPATRWYRGAF